MGASTFRGCIMGTWDVLVQLVMLLYVAAAFGLPFPLVYINFYAVFWFNLSVTGVIEADENHTLAYSYEDRVRLQMSVGIFCWTALVVYCPMFLIMYLGYRAELAEFAETNADLSEGLEAYNEDEEKQEANDPVFNQLDFLEDGKQNTKDSFKSGDTGRQGVKGKTSTQDDSLDRDKQNTSNSFGSNLRWITRIDTVITPSIAKAFGVVFRIVLLAVLGLAGAAYLVAFGYYIPSVFAPIYGEFVLVNTGLLNEMINPELGETELGSTLRTVFRVGLFIPLLLLGFGMVLTVAYFLIENMRERFNQTTV